jgi:hypothetical protein
MKGRMKWAVGVAVLAAVAAFGTVAVAGGGGGKKVSTELTGYEEVPAISTTGNGTFKATIDTRADEIRYRLSYADLEGDVTQAHIHFGQRAVNGDIVAFLCSNVPTSPLGTPECPGPRDGTVEGTIEPIDVLDTDQGITQGEFDELVAAIRAGVTYANVHSTLWPGGEIRGQLDNDEDDDDRDDDGDDD